MIRSRAVSEWVTRRLPELMDEHGVPGAQVAVLMDGEVLDAGAGVLNTATGVPVTTDAVFQIGSITKVWTATLVQQLVNEGLLELDRPLREYLPEFHLADETAAATVTARQLLCHTAGFEGDLFTDTGGNDDAVEKYVATLAGAAQVFPPGERFSYCNSGYVVLGRLVEVLRGKPFATVLRERLITPLRLEHVATNIAEAILERPAVGHVRVAPDERLRPASVWSLPPSNAPAGSTPAMCARSLLGFVRMHLSDSGFDLMRQPQVVLPDLGMPRTHCGLSWMLLDYPGGTVIGHDGATIGQSAFLRVVPEAGIAVALLANGGDVVPVYHTVFSHLLAELAGVELPALPVPPADPQPVDADRVSGTYRTTMAELELSVDAEGRAWLRTEARTEEAKRVMPETTVVEVVRLHDDALVTVQPQAGIHQVIGLLGADSSGRVRFLHSGGRSVARAPT
ncbi:MAG: beta-lactamase family protein [Pseudonocardiales bacterium]|nr:beta-lactamase family protein [Pseudonocardiales bacterium]MBW0009251.1 beta-lactamase family protein [Pseudonocardiales bacterium]